MSELDDSFRFAARLARHTARNFYFAFLTLPRALRRDMCALYAFMRHTDDLGDDESLPIEKRQALLNDWERRLQAALNGLPAPRNAERESSTLQDGAAIFPALVDVVRRHSIPARPLFDVIYGVRGDLTPRRFETFEELEAYCHLVAGAVGVCCIHIWSFNRDQPEVIAQAIDTGTAFQLTNILRDLGEDLDRGRLYLPLEDLRRFGLEEAQLRHSAGSAAFRELMAFQVQRARKLYHQGSMLLPALGPHGRRVQSAMLRIYGGILNRIEARNYDVFSRRIRLPLPEKLLIAAACMAPWGGRSTRQ